MNRLFSVNKIPVFVESYGPGVEKRRGEEVSVLKVRFKVEPFDNKLATALDEGVGEDSNIRATVFSLQTGEPKKRFTSHDFKLEIGRQVLELFATPDTENARLALDQVKIESLSVKSAKDSTAMRLIFRGTFGPVGRDELEYIHSLHRRQVFVTFTPAEPLLDMEDDEQGDEDADDEDVHEVLTRAEDDGEVLRVDTNEVESDRRPLISHQKRRKARAPKLTDADANHNEGTVVE